MATSLTNSNSNAGLNDVHMEALAEEIEETLGIRIHNTIHGAVAGVTVKTSTAEQECEYELMPLNAYDTSHTHACTALPPPAPVRCPLINSCRYTRVGQAKVAHRLDRSCSKEVERGKRCYVTPHPRRAAEIDIFYTRLDHHAKVANLDASSMCQK